MSLFSIETALVPLDAETYLGEKREIIPEAELIALTENNYIPLTQAQISLCAKIDYMYYCEYAHAQCTKLVFPLTVQTAFCRFSRCLHFSCHPRCALVWGMVVRGFACRDLC